MISAEFYTGKMFDAYEFFGAHIEGNGVVFRVYAPSAQSVQVIGDFNGWCCDGYYMNEEGKSGVYSLHIEGAREGMLYKYRIHQKDGRVVDKADPYGFGMELRPKCASVIVDLDNFRFEDDNWIRNRSKNYDRPMNIYEVHLGSWKTNPNNENGWYSYREVADRLIPYALKAGYTHLEILPIAEYPSDESWGYQTSGFFSPTSRYGNAKDLMYLVNECHKAGIGVILDFVLVHFVVDDYALAKFDGTALYEYPDNDSGYSEWGSHNFNYYRGEVRTLLQSAANYWLDKYHFDGLRMDAISNALYWQGNVNRGANNGAIEFIKNMNIGLHENHPTAMIIAEDSTCFPKVTAPVQYGGLGFDYKWDMGWMNDTLKFFEMDPIYRKSAYGKLCFSMDYFYNELFLLPFSHDEVVHGKKTIIDKIFGNYEEKFKQCRTLYVYMYMHPGKKLNFMGNEMAVFEEWNEKKELYWNILSYPIHDSFNHFMMELNHFYIKTKEVFENEYSREYFKWLDLYEEYGCLYGFVRGKGNIKYLTVMNVGNIKYDKLRIKLDCFKEAHEIINTDQYRYSGEGFVNDEINIINNNEIEIKLNSYSSTIIQLKC